MFEYQNGIRTFVQLNERSNVRITIDNLTGKGKARVDARRVKKMSRKAKESQDERPKKVQKVGAKTRAVPVVEVDDVERVQILDPRANDPFDETADDDVMVDDTRGNNMNEYVCAVGDGMIPLSVDGVSDHMFP